MFPRVAVYSQKYSLLPFLFTSRSSTTELYWPVASPRLVSPVTNGVTFVYLRTDDPLLVIVLQTTVTTRPLAPSRTAPHYLAETIRPVSSHGTRQHLRSAETSTLLVPSTRRSTLGDRSFPVAAARAWNALP